jgi:hypothetical protein
LDAADDELYAALEHATRDKQPLRKRQAVRFITAPHPLRAATPVPE